jgi:hypothetical protein
MMRAGAEIPAFARRGRGHVVMQHCAGHAENTESLHGIVILIPAGSIQSHDDA